MKVIGTTSFGVTTTRWGHTSHYRCLLKWLGFSIRSKNCAVADALSDPPVFLALDVGSTVGEDGLHHPTVVIDVSNNPEVADLPRVHAIDGIGDVSTAAIRTGDAVVLGVQLTRPVTAAFAVVFDLKMHGQFLNEVADANSLTFATTSPAVAGLDQPLWLSVDIDVDLLREALKNSIEPGDR